MASYRYFEGFHFTAGDRITWAVQRLILANAAIFAVQLLLAIPFGGYPPGGIIADWLAFQAWMFRSGCVWQPLTYMFLHGGLMHLFMNMLWLFFFGPDIERALGTRQFFRFYVLCGAASVMGAFVQALLGWGANPVVGASGAVMAVMVAFAMVNPTRQFFLFPFPVPINARLLVLILIVLNLLAAGQGNGVSVATHFGGMIVGYAYMKLVPQFRRWQQAQWRERNVRRGTQSPEDPLGEAVDNIFKFEDRKRRS